MSGPWSRRQSNGRLSPCQFNFQLDYSWCHKRSLLGFRNEILSKSHQARKARLNHQATTVCYQSFTSCSYHRCLWRQEMYFYGKQSMIHSERLKLIFGSKKWEALNCFIARELNLAPLYDPRCRARLKWFENFQCAKQLVTKPEKAINRRSDRVLPFSLLAHCINCWFESFAIR